MALDSKEEAALIAEMRGEAFDAAEDRIRDLRTCLARFCKGDMAPVAALDQIRQLTHSLKGIGASFDLPVLAEVAHRFEDFMAGEETLRPKMVDSIQIYTDRMEEAVEEYGDARPEAAGDLIEKLPV